MASPCNKPLKTNPFISRRDPKTGRWHIIKQPPRKPMTCLGKTYQPRRLLTQISVWQMKGIPLLA